MIQFTYCGQCLPSLKNMSRVDYLIFLPKQLACVVFSLKTCTVMASEMSDIAHVMSVCFQTYCISKCCHRFMDCFHLFSIIAINFRHSSSISDSMLKTKLPPYSPNDTTVLNSVTTAHSSALITSTRCAAVLTLGSTTSVPQYSWQKYTFKMVYASTSNAWDTLKGTTKTKELYFHDPQQKNTMLGLLHFPSKLKNSTSIRHLVMSSFSNLFRTFTLD